MRDEKTIDAVIMNLEIIGKALKIFLWRLRRIIIE